MTIRRSLEIDFLHNLVCPEFPLHETPFLSSLDVEQEYLTVYNPSSNPVALGGFFLSDSRRLHRFVFAEDTVMEPLSQLHIYTCPGGKHNHGAFIEPYVLWTNSDGSLRKKEVLNNEHCTMQLHASNGKCLASITGTSDGHPPRIQRRSEELQDKPPWQLNISDRITCSLVRLCCIAFMMAAALLKPELYATFYWVAVLFDIAGRSHIEELEPERRLLLLDSLGDRANLCCLYFAALKACSHHIDSYIGKATFLLLFVGSGLELCSWNVDKVHKKREGPSSDCHDLYFAIRSYFDKGTSSDFYKLGNLCVTLICVGSEVALVMLFVNCKFSTRVPHRGVEVFDVVQLLVLVATSVALVCRQVNNVFRVLHSFDSQSGATAAQHD